MEFRLPELGEGIESATVSEVLVQAGQTVEAGQDVLNVETDKASMPVPMEQPGQIGEIKVKVGDNVTVGETVFTFEPAGGGAASPPPPPPAAAEKPTPPPPPAKADSSTKQDFTVPDLGEGIDSATVVRVPLKPGDSFNKDDILMEVETDKAAMPIPAPAAGKVEEVRVKEGQSVKVGEAVFVLTLGGSPAPAAAPSSPAPPATPTGPRESRNGDAPTNNGGVRHDRRKPVPAGPATRRLARELNVDLHDVAGTAQGGRVTIDDVQNHVRGRMNGQGTAAQPAAGGTATMLAQPPLPDFAKWGPVERKPASRIRKTIAENMTRTWVTCPSVTQFDEADITDLEAGRKRVMAALPKGSPKITMTVLAVKAAVAVLREFPHFNASFDMAGGEVIYKQYYHIGIAVDTERGLVVPVIRDADKKTVRDIAAEVTDIAGRAREGKLTPDEMKGGTFTITNLGGVGGVGFSPIINHPEVAILGMARSKKTPVYNDSGAVEPRLILPLCLTYDHRIIDGADGARFTSRLGQIMSDPVRMLMEG